MNANLWSAVHARRPAVPLLLFAGGATVDLTPLNLYLSLQLGDVLLVAAGLIAIPVPAREVPNALISFLRTNRAVLVAASLGVFYLAGTGLSTVIAGAPSDGVETWLLFALLIGLVSPLTAVAVACSPNGMIALTLGLVCGGAIGAFGFVAEAVESREAVLHGLRTDGIFDSDQAFLMVIAVAILVTYLATSAARRDMQAILRPGFVLASLCLSFILVGLAITRYRAAWLGATTAILLAVAVVLRRVRALVATIAVMVAATFALYASGAVPDPLVERLTDSFSFSQPDVSQRREATSQLLNVWATRPWGIGLGESDENVSQELVQGGNSSIHNVVIHALVEGGPLAAVALALAPFVLTFLAIRGLRQAGRWTDEWPFLWTLPAVWAVFVMAQFSPSLYEHAAWTAIGALVGSAIRLRALSRTEHA